MKPWRERDEQRKKSESVSEYLEIFGFSFTFSANFLLVFWVTPIIMPHIFEISANIWIQFPLLKAIEKFRLNKNEKNLFDERTIYKNNAFYFLHLSSKQKKVH